jgi:hypothetical protein
MMKANLQESIARQRQILKGWLSSSLSVLAEDCAELWLKREALEERLEVEKGTLPYIKEQSEQITVVAKVKGAVIEGGGT